MSWVPITLTTPRTGSATGSAAAKLLNQHVKNAQYLLQHNRFGETFLDGGTAARDGIYGPHTASAVAHAKYMLGYPKSGVSNVFGKTLYQYLVPVNNPAHKRLPLTYKARRAVRVAQATRTIGQKALAVALTQVGISEYPPYSNRVKYTAWYGMIGPWCAMFESWCFAQVGGKFRYSYVPTIHSDAANGYNGLRITHDPQPGDIVCYTFDTQDQHTGFFHSWISKGSTFYAVEGNTGGPNPSDGGTVAKATRYISNVDAFVRVTR